MGARAAVIAAARSTRGSPTTSRWPRPARWRGCRQGTTFIYVSGEGTDSTERKRAMWARVKGRTENALLQLPLRAVMFRPGLIRPLHGIKSKTRLYRAAYIALRPLFPLLGALGLMTTTERVGQAMLQVVRHGAPRPIVTNRDIDELAVSAP
ncbi:MAG TPA: hypothetical protein VHW23_33540 [Kofleriaceae bacterium]|jgi:hypothetical protein|nr:hypothetical protein [Kofleriaceae bacterium]